MSHILVTGGAGYIGSHTVSCLLDLGYKVSIIDNLSTGSIKNIPQLADFYFGDFSDHSLLKKINHSQPIETIFHFAAYLSVEESTYKRQMYLENNFDKTKALLLFCQNYSVKHFIFSSSCTIYGNVNQPTVAGHTPSAPINPYGQSKLMVEQLLATLQSTQFSSLSLRYFNVAGADLDKNLGPLHSQPTQLIPLASLAACGKLSHPLKIFGNDYLTRDGTCIRDYIHLKDISQAHIKALHLLQKGAPSQLVYNVGYGQGYTVKEVIQTMKKVSGIDFPVIEAGRRDGDPPCLTANSDRFKKESLWSPQYNDLEAICLSAYHFEKSK